VTVTPDLLSTLRELADLAEIRGAAVSAADLRRAVTAIEALDRTAVQRLVSRARRGRLENEPGISPTIHWSLRELASGGGDDAVRAARSGVPYLIRRLRELPALTSAEAVTLARGVGVLTLQDLVLALDDRRVAASLGDAAAGRLSQAARALDMEGRPFTLGRAMDYLDGVIASIAECGEAIESITPSGEIRRFEPLVPSFIVVVSAADPPSVIDTICAMRGVDDVLHRSLRRCVLLRQEVEVDVRVAAPDELGTVLFATTGSRAHLAAMRQRRPRPGLMRTEEEIYAAAGLSFIAPELRNANGEIEAAARQALPSLVSRSHIRGDLHMHSTFSDGTDSVEAMVAECGRLGYAYIAIADHSEGAAASRTLARDQIAQQRLEIERLRARCPAMTILHGIEVDILLDGRLDFEDEILEPFDIVLASLHESGHQDGKTLTRRCIQAIRHPLVTIISHPANRLVGRRAGYPLDFDAIYAAAAVTGTALEVDGAPGHLDLDGEHARAAVSAGVTVTIDSDCHRARSLDRQMRFGIGTARRGWVEPRHVLNTRPLDEVLRFIGAKRIKG
jgi:DNA polymerase (family 10)